MNSYQNYISKYQDLLNRSKDKRTKTSADKQKKTNELLINQQNLELTKQAQEQAKQVNNYDLNAKAQSAIAQEQALKYMPSQLQAQGLGQTGASEKGIIDIRNAYLNAINNQNINTNQMQQDLFSSYQNKILNNNQNLFTSNAEIERIEDEKMQNEQANYMDYYVQQLAQSNDIDTYNKYLKYAKQYLSPENYDILTSDLELQDLKTDLETSGKIKEEMDTVSRLYNVKEGTEGIDVNMANYKSFGKFAGTGNNGVQDKWVNEMLTKARNGEIKNGDIVNFNYGYGKSANYVFYNGKFYKTTSKTADYQVAQNSERYHANN